MTAKASGGTLYYAEGWPNIENIAVDLAFRGNRMEIIANQATIYGAKLAKVRAVVPDLMHHDEIVEVEGEAQGPSADFLKFIETSPVEGYIDHFTEGMRVGGQGSLKLKLHMPLRRINDTKVAGAYQFTNAQIVPGPDLPLLDRVNGRIDFTESELKAQNISAQILGGPDLNAASAKDGWRANRSERQAQCR